MEKEAVASVAEAVTTDIQTVETKSSVLYVGIDLGTSRTVVAASNGVRESFLSYVGYPKDMVSRKVVKQRVLYGEEALRHRLSLMLYKPLAKGVFQCPDSESGQEAKSYARAAADLVSYAVSLTRPRANQRIHAVIGCPAQAALHDKQAIREAAHSVVDALMICSEPFAVAYGVDRLNDTLVIDIGGGTTDLCRMQGTLPTPDDQVTLEIGGDDIDAELKRLLEEACPGAQFSIHKVRELKEKFGYVGDEHASIYTEFPVKGKSTRFEVSEPIRDACQIIVEPIVEAIDHLITTFDPDFQITLKNNVLLSGGGSQMRGLGDSIEAEMQKQLGGGHVSTIIEPVYAGANGALKLAREIPEEYWEYSR